jgi:purine catabolism regulator
LVEETDLGLKLVAGLASRDRLVTGVHISEIPDPTRWLAPRTVLLSTGIILKDDPALGPHLIGKLAAADTAAFGIDPYLYLGGQIPAAMVEAADRLSFPLFSIPLETPFRAITAYVHSSLISRDFHRLRRSLSVQNHLLGQLLEDRGVGHLISSLATLLSTTAVLFDRTGIVRAQAQARLKLSETLTSRAWDVYAERRPEHVERQSFLVEGQRVDYREISHRGRVEEVLCLLRGQAHPLPDFADVILSYAQKLLTLDLLRAQDSLLLRKRMQTSLLEEMLAGSGHPRELAERARHQGFDPDKTWRTLLFETRDAPRLPSASRAAAEERRQQRLNELLDTIDSCLSSRHATFLSSLRGDRVVVLLHSDAALPELRSWMDALCVEAGEQAAAHALRAGVSEAYHEVQMIPASLEQALEALEAPPPGESRISAFADLGPRVRVLENQSIERLRAFYQATLHPLAQYDREHSTNLVESVEVYLSCDRSVSEAAARLFVHRNTLRNRLQKVEDILGCRVDATDTLVDLYLGLKAARMLDGGKAHERGAPFPGPRADSAVSAHMEAAEQWRRAQ